MIREIEAVMIFTTLALPLIIMAIVDHYRTAIMFKDFEIENLRARTNDPQ